jgi:hypothetical protein
MLEQTNPPAAIVRAHEDLETCLANAERCGRRIVKDSLECGEWLLKAKAACPHGQWLPSLAKHGFSVRTAQRLMEKARAGRDQIRQLSHLEMDAADGPTPEGFAAAWREAGAWFPAATWQECREWVSNVLDGGTEPLTPEGENEEEYWHEFLLRTLAREAARHLLRTGKQLPPPPFTQTMRSENDYIRVHNEFVLFQLYTESKAGRFLIWLEKLRGHKTESRAFPKDIPEANLRRAFEYWTACEWDENNGPAEGAGKLTPEGCGWGAEDLHSWAMGVYYSTLFTADELGEMTAAATPVAAQDGRGGGAG